MTEPVEPMPEAEPGPPEPDHAGTPLRADRDRMLERARALLEVFLCSGVPTQLLIGQLLLRAGVRPFAPGGHLDPIFVFVVTLADTILLVLLALLLLRAAGESPRAVFLGSRSVVPEVSLGLMLVVPLLIGVALVLVSAQRFWPALHNVHDNPLAGMMKAPRDAVLFAVVGLVGGGVREEVQRAFLLTRFERHLGGPVVGLIVTSVAFGAGHWLQGWDAAVATGLLGLFWGVVYLKRRSAVAPMVSHAGFNSLEILRFLVVGAGGV